MILFQPICLLADCLEFQEFGPLFALQGVNALALSCKNFCDGQRLACQFLTWVIYCGVVQNALDQLPTFFDAKHQEELSTQRF